MPSKLSKKRILLKLVMRSYKLKAPRGLDLPIRLRPWFVGLTILVLLCLSFLGEPTPPVQQNEGGYLSMAAFISGFTNIADEWPLNDKVLHFICFALATGVFYFVIDVDEESRHILFWRYFGLGLSGMVCLLGGGIASEFVQALLPGKIFQWGDVIANLLGATVGLLCAYRLERYYRFRREVARLYQPVGESEASDSEEELLPTHISKGSNIKGGEPSRSNHPRKNDPRLGNVWDSREDFDIGSASGSESDEEDRQGKRRPNTDPATTPQIVISQSS